ncbi:hypothetical protein DM860_000246 [Cuscuta australis]|uniref:F-box/LRR-repeat protein 15/At3g58940/PEG3-like LRR domain-containing protein n=1 Tax=Cuscuta australis TaxID=267555 RepID=A0A328CW05_9ASTE|nr:hypothetical protein DM860_000246 [Cuscuta australis]
MLRSGPVKTFKLVISKPGPHPLQFDLELWCRYLSRNGIEDLHLASPTADDNVEEPRYKLPFCIFSCPTIKRLKLEGFNFDCPANAQLSSVFSGLTSLELTDCVVSMHHANGIVAPYVPNLEKLVFLRRDGWEDFFMSVQPFSILLLRVESTQTGSKWVESHFQTIKTLHLYAKYLLVVRFFSSMKRRFML